MSKIFITGILLLMGITVIKAQVKVYSLEFDPRNYAIETAEISGKTITYRVYKDIVYIKNPVDTKYQCLNFYVPTEYYEGKSIGNYNSENAPIFMPNNVGGYMPAEPGTASIDKRTGKANAALVALSRGYVIAYPGARGRTLQDENGKYYGKAPADIVDLKAAVRYLKYNNKVMPGDAAKIISNGTSAGGAMSVLLGGTGNNPDYTPYLRELGAADTTDDIFAVSAYCPITDLDHADAAYEWQFNGAKTYKKMMISQMTDYRIERKMVEDTLTEEETSLSDKLKLLYPDYINSLELKDKYGNALTLNKEGEGSFKKYLESYIMASAKKKLDDGVDLSSFDWLTIKDEKVSAMDFDKYVQYTQRMKLPPAFDGLKLENAENDLFGTEDDNAKHFTRFSFDNSQAKATMAEARIIKMMNPLYYIGENETQVASHWRIRHGTIDKDGSLATPVLIATKLQNLGYDVDLALPWETPHSGDYDLDELFSWIENLIRDDRVSHK